MYYSKPEIIFADFDRGRNVAGIVARRRTMSLSAPRAQSRRRRLTSWSGGASRAFEPSFS